MEWAWLAAARRSGVRYLLLGVVLLAACGGGDLVVAEVLPEQTTNDAATPAAPAVTADEEAALESVEPTPLPTVAPTATTRPSATPVPPTPTPTEVPAVLMPDVLGLSEGDAVDVLFSAGIERPKISTLPSLEPAGTVIDQVPSAGTEVIGPVRLVLTEPLPPMPDVVGQRIDTVRRDFKELGVVVREEGELTTDRPDGEVLRTIPAAGEQVGAEIVAIVAAAPEMHDLSTLDRLVQRDGSYFMDTVHADRVSINGEVSETALWVKGEGGVDAGDWFYMEFNLGRDWDLFEAHLGLTDNSNSAQAVRITISLDGNEIYKSTFALGQSEKVSLGIENGLRLRFDLEAIGDGSMFPAIGDPRLLRIP